MTVKDADRARRLRALPARILKGLLIVLLAMYAWSLIYSAYLRVTRGPQPHQMPPVTRHEVAERTGLAIPAGARVVDAYEREDDSIARSRFYKMQMTPTEAKTFTAQKRLVGAQVAVADPREHIPLNVLYHWEELDAVNRVRCWTVDEGDGPTLRAMVYTGDAKVSNVYVIVDRRN